MIRRTLLVVGIGICLAGAATFGQQPPALVGAQFDVVSIKRNMTVGGPASMGSRPDGSFAMKNRPIRALIASASPVPVREVTGLPEWTDTEHYDIMAKPAQGSSPTPEQRAEMLRNMIIERMKLIGHVEEVERNAFALVLARADGRLGPQLKPSDCVPASPSPVPPAERAGTQNRCGGMSMNDGLMSFTGATMDQLARAFERPAGEFVTNRTNLDGYFVATLKFAAPILTADSSAPADDAPQFVTALREQLGLKLVPEKTKVKIFVVDHIERPTPN